MQQRHRYAGNVIRDWTTAITRFPCNEEYSLDLETKVYLSEIEGLKADKKSKLSKICFAPLEDV